jgi:RimJ/RimL family protein N-acetyltransferase
MARELKLETRRLLLRLWRPGDAERLADIEADLVNHVTLADERHHIERYVRHWSARGYGRWAVEEKQTRRLVGRVGVMHQAEWHATAEKDEIGWTIDPACWRQGYATEGALAALVDVFQRVALQCVISYTSPDNNASRRVMEKCGFTFQGHAVWRGNDVVWYALTAAEWSIGFAASSRR